MIFKHDLAQYNGKQSYSLSVAGTMALKSTCKQPGTRVAIGGSDHAERADRGTCDDEADECGILRDRTNQGQLEGACPEKGT